MPKFRNKTIVIEAVQFDGEHLPTGVRRCTETGAAYVVIFPGARCNVVAGDWIITEPDGKHFYPCKAEIFANTYEPADAGQIFALEFPPPPRVHEPGCAVPSGPTLSGEFFSHLAIDHDLRDADLDYLMNHVAGPNGFVRPLIREIRRRRAAEKNAGSVASPTETNLNLSRTEPLWLRNEDGRLRVLVKLDGQWRIAIDMPDPGQDYSVSHIWEGWIDTAKPDPITSTSG